MCIKLKAGTVALSFCPIQITAVKACSLAFNLIIYCVLDFLNLSVLTITMILC